MNYGPEMLIAMLLPLTLLALFVRGTTFRIAIVAAMWIAVALGVLATNRRASDLETEITLAAKPDTGVALLKDCRAMSAGRWRTNAIFMAETLLFFSVLAVVPVRRKQTSSLDTGGAG